MNIKLNQIDDNNLSDQIVSFTITDQMKKAGISQFFLEKQSFIIKFEEGGMRCYTFSQNLSISEIVNKLRQKLKHELNYDELQLALQDMENQIIERRNEIYQIKENDTKVPIHTFIKKDIVFIKENVPLLKSE